jgi:hypothetical protein
MPSMSPDVLNFTQAGALLPTAARLLSDISSYFIVINDSFITAVFGTSLQLDFLITYDISSTLVINTAIFVTEKI